MNANAYKCQVCGQPSAELIDVKGTVEGGCKMTCVTCVANLDADAAGRAVGYRPPQIPVTGEPMYAIAPDGKWYRVLDKDGHPVYWSHNADEPITVDEQPVEVTPESWDRIKQRLTDCDEPITVLPTS